MRHIHSPFLLVIGPGVSPLWSLQTRSIPTEIGGGEPSSIVTVPATMIGYVFVTASWPAQKRAVVMPMQTVAIVRIILPPALSRLVAPIPAVNRLPTAKKIRDLPGLAAQAVSPDGFACDLYLNAYLPDVV
jgi:hypothetical protein